MFAYAGDSRKDLQLLVSALRKAAEKDTTAERVPLKEIVHPDGWGFALYSNRGMAYYRSDQPIFKENVILPPTDGKVYAIFHARKASKGNPVKTRFSHPFFGTTENSFIFLAHNGSLDKERLARTLGLTGDAIDSELALKYAMQKGLAATSNDLEDYTKMNSALNLLVLEIRKDGGEEVFLKQFYRKEGGKLDKTRYYEICHENLRGGRAVFSSTLNDYGFSGKPIGRTGLLPLSSL